MFTKRKKK